MPAMNTTADADAPLYLGLMSGTSADGIDAALVQFPAGGGCRFDPHTIQRDIFALLGLRAVLFALLYLALRFKEGRR